MLLPFPDLPARPPWAPRRRYGWQPLDQHLSRERGAELRSGGGELEGDGPIIGRALGHYDLRSRQHFELRKVAQALRILVTDPDDARVRTRFEVGQGDEPSLVDRTLACRDGRAMRIDGRFADGGGHAIDELVRCRMFQTLGFLVH